MTQYKYNTDPKVGDIVKFNSQPGGETFRVTGVQGGRLGNKITVVPVANPKTFSREYYFYCFSLVTPA